MKGAKMTKDNGQSVFAIICFIIEFIVGLIFLAY